MKFDIGFQRLIFLHRYCRCTSFLSDNTRDMSVYTLKTVRWKRSNTDIPTKKISSLENHTNSIETLPHHHVSFFNTPTQAEIWSDFLREGIEDGRFRVEDNRTPLAFVPRCVLDNLETNQSMRNGFINLYNHIVTCLRGNMVPNEPNVETVLREARE